MQSVAEHLIQISQNARLTYTSELIPQQTYSQEMSVDFSDFLVYIGLFIHCRIWRLAPKQDHLVCFLGGSLMLGATITGAVTHPVSIPPKATQLTTHGVRDWINGVELIKTCMKTHDTKT